MDTSEERRTIELSLLKACPVRCHYCPQDVLTKASQVRRMTTGRLAPETLSAVLRNAADGLRAGITVAFSGFTEPLRHPRALDLIEMCERSEFVSQIAIYSTGEGLTARAVDRLATVSKLARITFHVDGFANPQRAAGGTIWPLVPQIARVLPDAIFVLVCDTIDLGDVLPVADYLRKHGVAFGPHRAYSRASNVTRLIRTRPATVPVTCDKVGNNKAPVVLPDGTCVPCSNDYGLTLPLGNLAHQKWSELDFASVINLQANPASQATCFQDCYFARPAFSATTT